MAGQRKKEMQSGLKVGSLLSVEYAPNSTEVGKDNNEVILILSFKTKVLRGQKKNETYIVGSSSKQRTCRVLATDGSGKVGIQEIYVSGLSSFLEKNDIPNYHLLPPEE